MDTQQPSIPVIPVIPYYPEPVKAFRLLPDKTHTAPLQTANGHTTPGKALNPGDVIDLTQNQATAFADKFEAVDPKAEFVVKVSATLKTQAPAAAPVVPPVVPPAAPVVPPVVPPAVSKA